MRLRKYRNRREQSVRYALGCRSFLGSCPYGQVDRPACDLKLSEGSGFCAANPCLGAGCCCCCFCERPIVQPLLTARTAFGLSPKPTASRSRSPTQAMECEAAESASPHSRLPKPLSSLCNLMLSSVNNHFKRQKIRTLWNLQPFFDTFTNLPRLYSYKLRKRTINFLSVGIVKMSLKLHSLPPASTNSPSSSTSS